MTDTDPQDVDPVKQARIALRHAKDCRECYPDARGRFEEAHEGFAAIPVTELEALIEDWRDSTSTGEAYSDTLQAAWAEREKRADELQAIIGDYE